MCGITGFWEFRSDSGYKNIVKNMALQISHRGPNAADEWTDPDAGIALAHRRLSIIDLSPAGAQPMKSNDGRYIIVFNGEIYNHQALRKELETDFGASHWRGHSDTETLLAALCIWGVETTLKRLIGMFAIALWDCKERELILARDRLGEKPLFYGNMNGAFVFGSELKALSAHPNWQGVINRDALTLYLRHNYVPTPHCIFKNIKKLPQAHYIRITNQGKVVSEPVCYWSLEDVVENGQKEPFKGNAKEATDGLNDLLSSAVKQQMMADVPLGAFLSGGYDSSLIVALMQEQASKPVKTFTIGFEEAEFNEAEYAKEVAKHLGAEHTELYVTANDALNIIPDIPKVWDEPFSDSSQIPTLLLSKLTREHVTVSLSGDGGDELFCGYKHYLKAEQILNKIDAIPKPIQVVLSKLLTFAPVLTIDKIMDYLPQKYRQYGVGYKMLELSRLLKVDNRQLFYQSRISNFKSPEDIVIGGTESDYSFNIDKKQDFSNFYDQMMYLDTKNYLADDILVKVDRASMAVSLETRVPMLDHRVVEFAWKLPIEYKLHEGQSKWILREVTHRYLPKQLMDRPKMGFAVPIDQWLRGPLKDWAAELLDPRLIKEQGLFNTELITKMWADHTSCKQNYHTSLWNILMFQAWYQSSSISKSL